MKTLVKYNLDLKSERSLQTLLQTLDVNVPARVLGGFHLTLIYSQKKINFKKVALSKTKHGILTRGLEIFDTPRGKLLVLLVQQDSFLLERRRYAEDIGGIDNYAFNPHITLGSADRLSDKNYEMINTYNTIIKNNPQFLPLFLNKEIVSHKNSLGTERRFDNSIN